MATEIQQVKISQLTEIADWQNSYTIATDKNGQSVKAPLVQVSKIGDLSGLTTSAKSSLVAAINEAATTGNVTVDSALSSSSTNPVQNRVINTALGTKQDVIADLSTIRSGAGAGATAVQPSSLKTINGESIVGSGDIPAGDSNAVRYVSQSLTADQKTQARTNIGAPSASAVCFIGEVVESNVTIGE